VSSAKDVAKTVLEDAREVLRGHEPSFLINLMVCDLVLYRDLNAARNILGRGLERALAETGPLLVRLSGQASSVEEVRSPHPSGVGSSH
jgi:hypothetical protein